MKKLTTALLLLAIVAIGFHMRMRSIAESIVDIPIRADARDYIFYAYNLKFNHVYSRDYPTSRPLHPDAVRSPGYPLFLSAFLDENISKISLKKILFAQVILSTVIIILSFCVFSVLLNGSVLSLLVASLVALSPHLITANIYFLSETVFCFLLLMSLFALSCYKNYANNFISVLFGVALAITVLTRPWLNYFIIIFLLFLFVAKHDFGTKKNMVYISVGYCIPIFFWVLRNLTTLGIFSDDSLTINTLHHGLYPYFMYDYQPQSYGFPYRFDPKSAQIAASLQAVLDEIFRRFKESPLEYLQWYFIGKPIELFSWENNAQGWGDVFIYPVIQNPYLTVGYFQETHDILKALHPIIIFFFAISIVMVWLPSDKLGLSATSIFLGRTIALLSLYFIAVHCLGAPFPRYAIPMLPLIYGMSVFGILLSFRHCIL